MAVLVAAILLIACPLLALDRSAAEDEVREGNIDYAAAAYALAEDHFTSAIEDDDTWAVPYNNRGLARLHQGSFADANTDFELAKSKDAEYLAPYINKGKCLAAQELLDEAATELQAGLAKSPSNPKLLYNLAWVLDELGRYTEALTAVDSALAADATYGRALVGKGVILANLADAEDATEAFYAAINSLASGDLFAAMAAYNLTLLRSTGLQFDSSTAAQAFQEGLRLMSVGLDAQAIASLAQARSAENDMPHIPWVQSWAYLKQHSSEAASGALASAYDLMASVDTRAWYGAEIYVDGIKRGTTPATVRLLPSRSELSLRMSSPKRERSVVVYGDQPVPGALQAMPLLPASRTSLPAFAPLDDSDRDWLADDWETANLGDLSAGPTGDTDSDGLSNLREYWVGSDPKKADTDGDGIADGDQLKNGSDPSQGGTLPDLSLSSLHNAYLLSSSAHNSGLSHTNWASDAVLHNAGESDAQTTLFFLPAGLDNTTVGSKVATVNAGQSLKLVDIVEDSFGKSNASGAILIMSSAPLMVTSRTYNSVQEGTYGQYVPGPSLASAIVTDEEVRLIQLTKNGSFRTNVGFVNGSSKRVTINASYFSADGSSLGARSQTLEPFGYLQDTDVLGKLGVQAEDAYAIITSTTPGAKYFTYASVVDNRTGDPVCVIPVGRQREGASPLLEASEADARPAGDALQPAVLKRIEGPPPTAEEISPIRASAAMAPSSERPAQPAEQISAEAAATGVRILTSGVGVPDSVTGLNTFKHYSITVPANAMRLRITVTNMSTSNAFLYARLGSQVTTYQYDYISTSGDGPSREIVVTSDSTPRALAVGTWYIAVRETDTTTTSYTITATVTTPGDVPVLTSGTPVNGTLGEQELKEYVIPVSVDATKLQFAVTDITSDISVFVRFSKLPARYFYDYSNIAYGTSPKEFTISLSSTPKPLEVGNWYIAITGAATASYTLTATVTLGPGCAIDSTPNVPASAYLDTSVIFQAETRATNCASTLALEWDFGDSTSHSNQAIVGHAYHEATTYTWTLTARVADRTTVKSGTITVRGIGIYVPGSAHSGGLQGSNWRTDLEVHNPDSSQARFSVALLKRDQANPDPATVSLSLDGGRSVRYNDVVRSMFGFNGVATLRIEPSVGKVMVTSRTYNDQPQGTFGQFVPGWSEENAGTSSEELRVPQLSHAGASAQGFRTSLGVVNVSNLSIDLAIALLRGNGDLLGLKVGTLGPYEYRQYDRIFKDYTSQDVDDGFAVVSCGTAGGRFLAYASVADNRTNDPVYVPGSGSGVNREVTIILPGGVPLTLIRIPAGTFWMGSPDDERGRSSTEGPQHQVTLTKDFYLGKYEVTQAQWQAVMGSNPSSSKSCGGDCPVDSMSWNDIARSGGFLTKLNQHLAATSQSEVGEVRLPTEAEWEYAARAGTTSRFSHGDVLECGDGCEACTQHDQYLWWCGNAASKAHVVGSKQPNAWGLYDMLGSQWEYVADWYGSYSAGAQTDPTGPFSGNYRVIRGGCWASNAKDVRSAKRSYGPRSDVAGFRLAMTSLAAP